MFSLSLVSYSYVWYSAFGAQTTAYRFLTFKLAKVHYDVHFSQFIFTFGALDSVTCHTYCTVPRVCSANELFFFLDSKLQLPIATQSCNEFVYLLTIVLNVFYMFLHFNLSDLWLEKSMQCQSPEDDLLCGKLENKKKNRSKRSGDTSASVPCKLSWKYKFEVN